MTTPPSSVTLPPTFANSFWSTDYRTGFNSVYSALEAGHVQSQEILAMVKQKVETERLVAQQSLPPALRPDGFAYDEGASLRMGFEALLTSTVGESKARHRLADELMRSVYLPFSKWSSAHSTRIHQSRQTVERVLVEWEREKQVVDKAKQLYGDKSRWLDQVEDEMEFVRGREALLKATSRASDETASISSASSHRDEAQSGGGGIVLPPRPFEIDQNDTSNPLLSPVNRSRTIRFNRHSKTDDDQGSDDGTLPPIDNGHEDGFIDRSGATGGSVVAALGRALTVRRNRNATPGDRVAKEGAAAGGEVALGEQSGASDSSNAWKVDKLMEDKNVKAALDFSKTKFSSLLSKVAGPQSEEERYLKARREAETSEEQYKLAVESLESLRLHLEELWSTHLPYLQHCESDRLRAATSVLKSFHSAISDIPQLVRSSQERVQQTLELIRHDKDLKLLIERRRTGPFQPRPVNFASHYSEPYATTFGIDLSKYDETNASPNETGSRTPKVLVILLNEIERRMEQVEDTDERRKSWLYETPLSTQHALRSVLNSTSTVNSLSPPELGTLLEPFDLPILCSVVKLWLLELETPVLSFSVYDELRGLFPTRITTTTSEGENGFDREGFVKVVGKLPAIHLETLQIFLTHLYPLTSIEPSSSSSDSAQTYLSKLSLSLSRPLLRPKQETALTLDERFPVAVVGQLLKGGRELFGEIEASAAKERHERFRPRRQRTKPIDVRPSRTNMGLSNRESLDPEQANSYLVQQQQARLEQDLPPPPPSALPAGPEQQTPDETRSRGESLKLETGGLAPPVPVVAEAEGGGGDFAASPMESTSAFPRDGEENVVEGVPVVAEVKADQQDEEASPAAAALNERLDDEKPQVGGTTGAATETPFVPPTSSADEPEDEAVPPPANSTAFSDDKPLTSSTSLKRRSVQSTNSNNGASVGAGGGGGSGRLRGARAPRPISSSNSSVFDKVKQFEGGN
ncbi:hypothetical protein JCM11491_005328 [Sporobolomyces phaffii]